MNDYNVLILFFNNLERLKISFGAIRQAKPKVLFLYQDGPRLGKNDEQGITKCREYVETNLDWGCTVYKMYQKENVGCDPSEYIAQKWAFSLVDKCIILEDDDVASQDFFKFCWELLNKYENDSRISIICGMNNFDTYNNNKGWDYFFTSGGCIWGWASWRRVIELWDEKYEWLDDNEKLKAIEKYFVNKKDFRHFISLSKERRKSGVAYYETILGVSQMLNNQLNIVPTRNLISNIGNTNGVHTSSNSNLVPKKMRGLYYKQTFSLSYPLTGPDYVSDDFEYKKKIYKMNNLNFFEKVVLKLKRIFVK